MVAFQSNYGKMLDEFVLESPDVLTVSNHMMVLECDSRRSLVRTEYGGSFWTD